VRAQLAGEPPELVLGPVQARLVTAQGTRYRKAHDTVRSELDGTRYFALLEALDRLIAEPPLTERAAGSADAVLLPLAAKSWRRMRRRHDAAAAVDRTREPERHDAALHELRTAARRARYAGEALAPVHGRRATTWAARMEAVQETLGAHHDSVVIRARLRELGVAAHLDGENGFTYGRLHALEQARAEATRRSYRRRWDRAIRRSPHRWLRS
jgi:CHAD domain-containing protein